MTTTLFHSMTFIDADAAIAWLTAIGFTDKGTHRDESGAVVHAQWDWDERGGIMWGSRRADRVEHDARGFNDTAGHARCYCVVATDAEVDEKFAAALAAGATAVQAPTDPEYGGRTCTVRDHEGNDWSFGSYPGEP